MPALPELNYHHLRSFWAVAREGSIAKAGVMLKVSQPTISEQLGLLARAMGTDLFEREGRRLRLTGTGRLVLEYADEIFALGRELSQAVGSRVATRPVPVVIGISDAVSKLIACRLVAPALRLPEPVQITIEEDRHEVLLQHLAAHELDLMVSDAPLEPHQRIRACNHLLGDCAMAVFGSPAFAKLARGFPRSLAGAPLLAGLPASPQRRAWDAWCTDQGVQPRVVAQIQDGALLKTMGQAGLGIFAGPDAIAEDICSTFAVRVLGRIPVLRQRYYAISLERRLSNPALLALLAQGRNLFAAGN